GGTHTSAAVHKGLAYVAWKGQLDTLRAILSRLPADEPVGAHGDVFAHDLQLMLWERRGDRILRALSSAPPRVLQSIDFLWPTSLYAAWAHELRGERPEASVAFGVARRVLDSVALRLPNDWRVHAARGLVLASQGQDAEARAEARWLQQSPVYRGDAFYSSYLAERRAQILARLGDTDAALTDIERLLRGPSWQSAHTLQLDPRWDPIRNDPRFRELLKRYAVR
ncbi:MAG: tetratricopeptide repeat protein, partial [Gemmatimonadaceae bacterium]